MLVDCTVDAYMKSSLWMPSASSRSRKPRRERDQAPKDDLNWDEELDKLIGSDNSDDALTKMSPDSDHGALPTASASELLSAFRNRQSARSSSPSPSEQTPKVYSYYWYSHSFLSPLFLLALLKLCNRYFVYGNQSDLMNGILLPRYVDEVYADDLAGKYRWKNGILPTIAWVRI